MIYKKVTTINRYSKTAVFLIAGLLSTHLVHAENFRIVYIEAGEGNSSGGHLGVQLGANVFHYQHEKGMLRLFKQADQAFYEDYRHRQNRSLHVAEIAVSHDTSEQLSDAFDQQLFSQQQFLKKLTVIRQDQSLLKALLHGKTADSTFAPSEEENSLHLNGPGFFYGNTTSQVRQSVSGCDSVDSSKRIAAALKRQLAKQKGENFLIAKIDSLEKEIDRLVPNPLLPVSNEYSFSEHYADLLTGLLALKVLRDNVPLSENACFQIRTPVLKFSEAAVEEARLFRDELLRSALSLIASKRPDWGYALFVTLARLISLDRSIERREWSFLTGDDNAGDSIDKTKLDLYTSRIGIQRRLDLNRLLEKAQESVHDERDYVELELAANRYRRWFDSDTTGRLVFAGDQALPKRTVSAFPFLKTGLSVNRLKQALKNRETAEADLLEEDTRRNTYNLLTNNCVSALFKRIDQAVAGRSRERLGGYIDPDITFIPFQAYDAVEKSYALARKTTLPAYRLERLDALYAQGSENWVYLRESNVVTSSLYKLNPDDAWFVFFTDDQVVTRPIFGLVNVAAAVGQSLFGLVNWPFDDGKNIKTGLRGVAASLPELLFFNIRKGSYPYVMTQDKSPES